MHVILRTISSFFPNQKILFLSKVRPLKVCNTSPGFSISIDQTFKQFINDSNNHKSCSYGMIIGDWSTYHFTILVLKYRDRPSSIALQLLYFIVTISHEELQLSNLHQFDPSP